MTLDDFLDARHFLFTTRMRPKVLVMDRYTWHAWSRELSGFALGLTITVPATFLGIPVAAGPAPVLVAALPWGATQPHDCPAHLRFERPREETP